MYNVWMLKKSERSSIFPPNTLFTAFIAKISYHTRLENMISSELENVSQLLQTVLTCEMDHKAFRLARHLSRWYFTLFGCKLWNVNDCIFLCYFFVWIFLYLCYFLCFSNSPGPHHSPFKSVRHKGYKRQDNTKQSNAMQWSDQGLIKKR